MDSINRKKSVEYTRQLSFTDANLYYKAEERKDLQFIEPDRSNIVFENFNSAMNMHASAKEDLLSCFRGHFKIQNAENCSTLVFGFTKMYWYNAD